MVCHFVSDSHEVMTVLIVVLPLIVVVEISLQLPQASITCPCSFLSLQFFFAFFSLGSFGPLFLYKFSWSSQWYGWVFCLFLVLWQKLNTLVSVWHYRTPISGNWCNKCQCHGKWSLPYMLLSKVPEHVDDCHCPANYSSIVFCGIVLSFF
jgi:hypothetical protein